MDEQLTCKFEKSAKNGTDGVENSAMKLDTNDNDDFDDDDDDDNRTTAKELCKY